MAYFSVICSATGTCFVGRFTAPHNIEEADLILPVPCFFALLGRRGQDRLLRLRKFGDFTVPIGSDTAHFVHKCTRTGRDQTSHDDVFLQTNQTVDLAGNSCLQ